MQIKLFGLTLGSGKKPLSHVESTQKVKKSFVLPQADDDAINVETVGGFAGSFIDMDGTTRSDNDLVYKYREMAMHAETEIAIEDILCEAIVSEDNLAPVKIILDNLTHSVNVKKKIVEEFDTILKLLHFQTKGYELFRRWYIDSKLAMHIITDEKNPQQGILEVRYIDPVNLQKVKEYKKELNDQGVRIITAIEEYFIYMRDGVKNGNLQGLKISPDAICYVTSGLFDSRNKRTVGYLHKAIKPLNQLRMMEDAIVIYRISRSPERLVFYVDVGSLPRNKAEQYVRDLMNKYKNKLSYDANTGEIRDEKRHMSMMENYWLPRREGGKGTEVTTLPGAQNLSELDDVKYFLKKMYKSLNVPLSRLDGESKSFSIGKGTEITRDEIKFSKFINRLRNKFSEIFYTLLKTQLILKNIITPEEWDNIKGEIYFDYLKDSYFAELKQNEVTNERVAVLSAMEPYIGRYFSDLWVKKNILNQNDEDIDLMQKQMDQEKKEKDAERQEQMANGTLSPENPEGDTNEDPNAAISPNSKKSLKSPEDGEEVPNAKPKIKSKVAFKTFTGKPEFSK